MGFAIRLYSANRPVFGWGGPSPCEFAATSMALKSFAMACRAIAQSRGLDPRRAETPEVEVRSVTRDATNGHVEWNIARHLLEILPGRPRRNGISLKSAAAIIEATFAHKAQQQMSGTSFNGVRLGVTVTRPLIDDGVFRVRTGGLILSPHNFHGSGNAGAIGRWDPMDAAEALALGCAYAAQSEQARHHRDTRIETHLSRLPSATARAASLAQDERAEALRATLEAISGTNRLLRTSYQ